MVTAEAKILPFKQRRSFSTDGSAALQESFASVSFLRVVNDAFTVEQELKNPIDLASWKKAKEVTLQKPTIQSVSIPIFQADRNSISVAQKETAIPQNIALLREEVTRLMRQETAKGQTRETPWYLLSGTGFFVKEQVDQLLEGVAKGKQEGRLQSVLRIELSKLRMDILTFEQEYLKQFPVLPLVYETKVVNGRKQIICPEYGGKTLQAVISKQEREGAVQAALFGDTKQKGIEDTIIDGNKWAVMLSAAGWSNFSYADGSLIDYEEAQVYVINANGGFSLRSKLSIGQLEKLRELLGGSPLDTQKSEKEQIKQLVKAPIFLEKNPALDILGVLQKITGSAVMHGNHTFAAAKDFMQNPKKLWASRKEVLDEIQQSQEYAEWEIQNNPNDLRQRLAVILGRLILRITNIYKNMKEAKDMPTNVINAQDRFRSIDYFAAKVFLEQQSGCSGGGSKKKKSFMETAFGMRSITPSTFGDDEIYYLDKLGKCKDCIEKDHDETQKYVGPCDYCEKHDRERGGNGKRLTT